MNSLKQMSAHRSRVVLTREATDDLGSIVLFSVGTWTKDEARYYFDIISNAFEHIAQEPTTCSLHDGIPGNVFEHDVGRHSIYFRRENGMVHVLRLLHWDMGAIHHLDPHAVRWIDA